jgi:zinc protease
MKHTELPLLQLHLVFESGSAADPIELSGLAEISAEMMLEGTKRRDKFAFESELEKFGTDLDAFTADNYTVYEMTTLTKHIDPSLDLLAEAILTPAFPETEFVDQKDRRLVDVRREKDNPGLTATKITRRVVYGDGHPYSQIGNGTETSLEAIGLEHVREFAQSHYTPGNATIVAVGNIDTDDLAARVSRAFDAWTGEAPATSEIPAVEPAAGRTVYLFDKPGDSQSTISIAHAAIPRNHPDWEKLFVANQVLGGMFSSRLNLNLREDKGYSYGVYCDTSPKVGVSSFSMEGRVQTEVTAPALVEFLKEFEGITKKRPITEEELSFAKDNILMGYSQGFETISQLADALTEQVAYGLPDDNFARYPERIASVDLATANKAASEHFHAGEVAIVVVGDRSKIEDSIQKLKLGPIRYVDENGQLLPEAKLSSTR